MIDDWRAQERGLSLFSAPPVNVYLCTVMLGVCF